MSPRLVIVNYVAMVRLFEAMRMLVRGQEVGEVILTSSYLSPQLSLPVRSPRPPRNRRNLLLERRTFLVIDRKEKKMSVHFSSNR